MAFTINTNIASLQAQNYLRVNSDFQSKTINRVTSGLRIVTSGDDAAGLAIANGYRSDEAVLTQGVRNANDGLSQLQIADGGISNISALLDRARTLATQSSSGALTGSRAVLNSEFQSLITEINRQAQAIGLNQGGQFAKALNVFIGGGKASGSVNATANGSVNIDLSQSTVDAKSLGLQGVQAAGVAGTDIGPGSTTSVQAILTSSHNQASIANNTTNFYFTGPSFSDTSGSNIIKVAVNLTGVTDANTLATALNTAITNAGNGASQQATAFKNAGITAAINTDNNGKQQLTFNSSTTAFQVQGGDKVATAVLGNFQVGGSPQAGEGYVATVAATAGSVAVTATTVEAINLRITGAGVTGSAGDVTVTTANTDTIDTLVSKINASIAGNAALAATGVTAQKDAAGTRIQIVGRAGESFEVATANDKLNNLGFGTFTNSLGTVATAGTFDYAGLQAAAAITASKLQTVEVSLNGADKISFASVSTGLLEVNAISNLNAAFQGNAATRAAGLVAADVGGKINITSSTTNFRLNFIDVDGSNAFGFGVATGVASAASVASVYTAKNSVNSSGAQQSQNATTTDVFKFTELRNNADAQTVTLTAVDNNGAEHTLNVALTTANAATLDQAVGTINTALLGSNDSTLRQLAAFKEVGSTGGTAGVNGTANSQEGIRFLSAGGTFKVSLGSSQGSSAALTGGAAANVVGLADYNTGLTGGGVLTSVANGTGSTADISNITTAQAAVTALAISVATLGSAQAVIGRGENQFNYAINLASSQLTNLAAAESRIRDADLAAESANLTKSQILLQAGIAALAQANSAPQQVLALLK
jgi:flagellin